MRAFKASATRFAKSRGLDPSKIAWRTGTWGDRESLILVYEDTPRYEAKKNPRDTTWPFRAALKMISALSKNEVLAENGCDPAIIRDVA